MKKMNMLVIGIIVMLLGTGIGTYIINKSGSYESAKTIQDLKDTLSLKNEELQQKQISFEKKQDENNLLQEKILEFQKKLDSNTNSITEVTKAISEVAIKTNQISNLIKNEQREKGKLVFDIDDQNYNQYNVKFGGLTTVFTKEELKKGKSSGVNDIVFATKMKDGKFVFSLKLYNQYGNIIFDMEEGQWALKRSDVFSVNYDSKGVEIIDKQGNVILQIDLFENEFRISGTFFAIDHVSLMTQNY